MVSVGTAGRTNLKQYSFNTGQFDLAAHNVGLSHPGPLFESVIMPGQSSTSLWSMTIRQRAAPGQEVAMKYKYHLFGSDFQTIAVGAIYA
jgi:hypothetical protein